MQGGNYYRRGNGVRRSVGYAAQFPTGNPRYRGPQVVGLEVDGAGAARAANDSVNQWYRMKESLDAETRRRNENSRQMACDQIIRLQNVVSKRYAFNDPNLADFYVQWRLATSAMAAFGPSLTTTDKAIQAEIISQYVRVFSLLVKIPFYSRTLSVPRLRDLLLRTYYVSGEWLKAAFIVINASSPRLLKETIFGMNEDGDNLLHIYVREGLYNRGILDLLVSICGINSVNGKGETPLRLAMLRDENSKKKFTTQLMEQGVDINFSLNSQGCEGSPSDGDGTAAGPATNNEARTTSEAQEPANTGGEASDNES